MNLVYNVRMPSDKFNFAKEVTEPLVVLVSNLQPVKDLAGDDVSGQIKSTGYKTEVAIGDKVVVVAECNQNTGLNHVLDISLSYMGRTIMKHKLKKRRYEFSYLRKVIGEKVINGAKMMRHEIDKLDGLYEMENEVVQRLKRFGVYEEEGNDCHVRITPCSDDDTKSFCRIQREGVQVLLLLSESGLSLVDAVIKINETYNPDADDVSLLYEKPKRAMNSIMRAVNTFL